MESELETAIVSYDEDTGIGTIVLDRPDSMNALNEQLESDIVTGFELLEERNEEAEGVALRAVVIEGAGEKAFCAGNDVGGFSDSATGGTSERSHRALIREFPAPVIAKIQGYCLGGGLETAFACDFRIASADSTFGLPEVDLGIIPGAGGIQYVSDLANPAVAKELAMTAEHFSAERAAEEGLVHEVHDAEDLDEAVDDFAEKIASKAPLAVQAVKEATNMATQTNLEEGIDYDRTLALTLLGTEDAAEGREAFAEKREPEFVGK